MSEPWLSLTEHLDRAADDGDFSGTVLVTAGEETLLHACHGIANRAAGVPVMRRTRFGVASLVGLQLETGRTHQIRVHMRFAGRPVLGDPVYGVTDFRSWPVPPETLEALKGLQGQALHAERLGITHPNTGERMTFQTPPPPDFQRALDELRKLDPQTRLPSD